MTAACASPTRRPAHAPRRARGFTLVEVLVALFIMAILSAMAFRGIDAISRARDGAQGATDRTLKLNSGMSQFEYDIAQMVDTQVLQPMEFTGNTLRITRRTPAGIQLVIWTLQDKRWQRWASPPVVHIALGSLPASLARGQTFTATGTVTDAGGSAASGYTVLIAFTPTNAMRLQSPQVSTQNVATVAAGGSQAVSWQLRTDNAASATVTMTLRDPSGAVVESASKPLTITN